MKEHIRTIGIDDAAFNRNKSRKTFVFGVVVRGNDIVEGVLRTEVTVDGLDATKRISSMIIKSKFASQIKVIFLASSTIAAFNIIDLRRLSKETKLPVVTILKKKPDEKMVQTALTLLKDSEKRVQILSNNPNFEPISFVKSERSCEIFVQRVNISLSDVKEIIKITTRTGCTPESLRLADMIGKAFRDYVIT